MSLSTLQLARLKRLYEAHPNGWEPRSAHHPYFDAAIQAGFLRRVDGRFGVERIKDAHIVWTQAGAMAMQAYSVTEVCL